MKAVLEFDVDQELEARRHLQCLKAYDALRVLEDVLNFLRNELKYNNALSEDSKETLRVIQKDLRDNMKERGVDLDELL